MKSLTAVRSNRSAVEPSHWMVDAIDMTNGALETLESDDTVAVSQDSIVSTRNALNELLQCSRDEQYDLVIASVQELAGKCNGRHSAALYSALRSLRRARSGPLPARIES